MYFIKPVLFSFFCSTAFAGLDDVELTKSEFVYSAPRSQFHYQDPSATLVNKSNVYKQFHYPNLPMFHTYHHQDGVLGSTGFNVIYTAALAPDAKNNLPRAVNDALTKAGITNPQVNIVLQSMNEYGYSKPDRDQPLLFRPHYFFSPDAPEQIKGTYSSVTTDWRTVYGPDAVKAQPEPKSGLIQEKHPSSLHHTVRGKLSSTIASPNSMGVGLDTDETKESNKNAIHNFFTIVKDRSTGKAAVTLHWLMSATVADLLSNAFREATDGKSKSTMKDVFDELEGKTGNDSYARTPDRETIGIGADRIAQLKSLFTGEGVISTKVGEKELPENFDLASFWAQNPGIRKWALGQGKFAEGNEAAERRYAKTFYKYSEKAKWENSSDSSTRSKPVISTKVGERNLPEGFDLARLWSQNPGVRDWALGQSKFNEGDVAAERTYAKTFYKYSEKAKWEDSSDSSTGSKPVVSTKVGERELPESFDLARFWSQNPGVRDWALGQSKFNEGDVAAERRYANTFYKFNPKAKWDNN